MEKKGVSQVVSVVILIALTVALVGSVWGIVNGFVLKGLKEAEACNGLLEKVTLNQEYLCYNSSSDSLMVSISRGEIELDSILILISNGDSAETVVLDSVFKPLPNVFNISSTIPGVKMPGEEEGQTYCVTGITQKPVRVSISLKRKGKQCDETESTSKILECTQGGC